MSRQSFTNALFPLIVLAVLFIAGCAPYEPPTPKGNLKKELQGNLKKELQGEIKKELQGEIKKELQGEIKKLQRDFSSFKDELQANYCRGNVTVALQDVLPKHPGFIGLITTAAKELGGTAKELKEGRITTGMTFTFEELGKRDYVRFLALITREARTARPQVILGELTDSLDCEPPKATARYVSLAGRASVATVEKTSVDLTFKLTGLLSRSQFWLVPERQGFLGRGKLEQRTGDKAEDVFRQKHVLDRKWEIRGKVDKFRPSRVFVMITRDVRLGIRKGKRVTKLLVEYRVFDVKQPVGTPYDMQIRLANPLAQPACPPPPKAVSASAAKYFRTQLGGRCI